MIRGMVIDMNDAKLKTLTQVKEFLEGTRDVGFQVREKDRYLFIERTLGRFGYERLGRKEKGIVLRYVQQMTGLSRQQVTRHVRQFRETGTVRLRYRTPSKGFRKVFDSRDVVLLAETDERHGTLSGPATKKLLERAFELYGDSRYERLSRISVSHLYNLRGGAEYRSKRRHWTQTRSTNAPIGERRPPRPEGSPGYLRIDSVHQGDPDGQKGVYHINAVNCVTQFQVVATRFGPKWTGAVFWSGTGREGTSRTSSRVFGGGVPVNLRSSRQCRLLPNRGPGVQPLRRVPRDPLPATCQDWSLRTVRWKLFSLAGLIVRHARSLVLKLAVDVRSLEFISRIRGQCQALFASA